MIEDKFKYYDGYCKKCNSENCGVIGGLAECVWEEARIAEEEFIRQRELKDKIVYVSKKFNLQPECIHAILEELGYVQ